MNVSAPDATFHWADLLLPAQRWTALRKAALVDAVARGNLDRDAMLSLHGISAEEFESWQVKRAVGANALRSTHLQHYPEARR